MATINRRQWIQRSLLASSAILVGGSSAAPVISHKSNSILANELLRLNWNENPYGPSEKARQAIIKALSDANRYPDKMVRSLKTKLAAKLSVATEQLILTAGSTEVLSLLGQHVGLLKGEILTPWPSFPTLIQFGKACGASIRKIPLDKYDRINLNQLFASISSNTKLIFVCNPNNPTSTELITDELRSFCRKVPHDVMLCVDEAYIEYSKHGIQGSMVSLLNELPNLVICRTFSKAYGLAGLRIGYAISSKENISALRSRHLGWELSAGIAPLSAALATLDDDDFLQHCVEKNKEGRAIVYRAFKKWGVDHNPSSTNFIYTRSHHFVSDIRARLREKKVLITKWPDMTDHIRISIGKPKEMEQFVKVVEACLV